MQYASKHLVIICSLVLLLVPLFSLFQPTPVFAQSFNQQINYQGKLADNLGATVADGSYSMQFRLYTVASGGSNIWSETQSVTVQNGLFSVMLGTSTSLSGVDFNQTLYLGVNIEADGEMTPRKILGAVPAAFEANNAQTLGGVASTSFLRGDIPNAASALLSFTGGFISSGSSTISELTTTGTTTVTTFLIDGEEYTSFSGGSSGLTNNAGTLTANISESNLNITGSPTNGYILQASSTATGGLIWNATSSLGFGTSNVSQLSGLSDVTLASLTAGDLFTYDGSNWVNLATSTLGIALGDTTGTLDISDRTNLSVSATGLELSGDALALTAGYAIPLSASTTAWNVFYDTPSSRIIAGTDLTWSGNTLNFDNTSGFISDITGESFLDLSDTPGSFTANRLFFTNSGGTAVTDSANLTFDGSELTLGGTGLSLSGSTANIALGSNYLSGDGDDEGIYVNSIGRVGIGTSTPTSPLSLAKTGVTGSGVTAGINQQYTVTTSGSYDVVYGNELNITNDPSIANALLGSIIRVTDDSSFVNIVRGLEVQTDLGANTFGENTALSGYARTFGVRGVTSGDAGGSFIPAGLYGQTEGTSQGNAIRGYSESITSANLFSLLQDTSTFTGDGLSMNFGTSGGSFTGRFLNLQNNSTTTFSVNATGTTYIADNLGIGTSTPSARLTVADGGIRITDFGAGSLTTDSAGNLTVSSDERLKDIQGVYISGIAALRSIDPIEYRWNTSSGLEQENIYVGFSAQNIQLSIPSAVGTSSGGMLTLSDRPILATVLNATKEQQAVFDALLGIGTTSATSTDGLLGEVGENSLWQKMVTFFEGFVDGVLEIIGLRTQELCVYDDNGETCVNREILDALLQTTSVDPVTSTNPDTSTSTNEEQTGGSGTDNPSSDAGTGTSEQSMDEETSTSTATTTVEGNIESETASSSSSTETDVATSTTESRNDTDTGTSTSNTEIASTTDASLDPEPVQTNDTSSASSTQDEVSNDSLPQTDNPNNDTITETDAPANSPESTSTTITSN